MTLVDSNPAAAITFIASVALSKDEVFGVCQALADAERVLRGTGHADEAATLWDVFELLERRLCA